MMDSLRNSCYKTLLILLGLAGLICSLLVWWIAFIYAAGYLFRGEFHEAMLAGGVFVISVIVGLGAGEIVEKLRADFPNT